MSDEYLFEDLFLCVGAMKSGTTWLSSLLRTHPDIYFTPEKEIHYFAHVHTGEKHLSDKFRMTRAKVHMDIINPDLHKIVFARNQIHWIENYLTVPVNDAWFKNLFVLQRHQKYSADFSNLNCHLDAQGWARVKAQVRNLKVLYIMRHPIERLWSHVKFHHQFSGRKQKLANWGPREYQAFATKNIIWQHARYGDIVTTLTANLSTDQLKIAFFEDIHQDQRKWLGELEDFLGIRHIEFPDARLHAIVNQSVDSPMPAFFPGLFETEISKQLTKLEKAGFQIPDTWQ